MRCTLLIPRLFWPQETADAVWSGLDVPALTKLVGRARAERFEPITPEGWLCQAFEVERQQDWPVAPLTLELDGGETGDAYCLRADPVHLRVDRDRLVLVESALFDVTAEEAQACVATLNRHFKPDGLTFHAPRPKRWYVRLERAPRLLTRMASEAAGRDVQAMLPAGEDALAWHRIFNEAQMLLHDNEANLARDARGEPVVNSVWFWGGGVHTLVRGHPYDAVWSDEALALALAAGADVDAAGCQADAAAWLQSAAAQAHEAASHLVVLNDLATASAHEDSEAWRRGMSGLEARWFSPLVQALRAGRVSHLALVTPGESACWRFDIARSDFLKIWRSARPWTEYA